MGMMVRLVRKEMKVQKCTSVNSLHSLSCFQYPFTSSYGPQQKYMGNRFHLLWSKNPQDML